MNSICLYFEVHQPFRLRPYSVFEIGNNPFYLDQDKNHQIMRKVGDKCYLPTTRLLLELIEHYRGDFRITFSVTGTAMEQFRHWYPEVMDQFKRLADTGQVEFLAETYYHSLASLYSRQEFHKQIHKHVELMQSELGVTPRAFRNTELIFSNQVAALVSEMGYKTILMEGADHLLGERSPNHVYRHAHHPELRCMLKNYRLSDDIAFRFSDRNWSEYPLSADKFSRWIHSHAGSGETFNLFMDFETFGEHQWADSGIFDFLRFMPEAIMKHPDFAFRTVSEAAQRHPVRDTVESDHPISWADTERDISAWTGNALQQQAINAIYELEEQVYASQVPELIDIYGKLQTSDHFYYMCTKYFNDGDVHKYFSPYQTPHDAYIYYMNVLHDFRQMLDTKSWKNDVA